MDKSGARAIARIAAGVVLAAAAARAADDKTVLTIYAETRLLPVIAALDQAIRSTLVSRSPAPIRFHTEYLDLSWFAGSDAEDLIARLLKEKYAGRRIDLVMPCGEAAIRFLLRERAALFPGVPIVFCTANRESIREAGLPPDMTGVTLFIDWIGMAELALRLHPATRRIVFIGGSGPTSRQWEEQARRALSKLEDRVRIEFFTGLAMPNLLKSVAALPEGTVGIFNAFLRDGAGRTFTTPEAVALVAGASRIPLYGFSETMLGHGVVGGPMVDFAGQAATAAGLAERILAGERLGPADIVRRDANTWMFDARQLKRWGIGENQLPPGSVVRFGEASTWSLYKWQIAVAIGLVLLEGLLIVGLLLARRQRKRAERRLEERLRFETLTSDLATAFIGIRTGQVDRQIQDGLRRVVEELGVDRASVGEFASGSQIRITHSWARPDVPSLPVHLDTSRLPWATARIRGGQVVSWSRQEELPEEAEVDRSTIRALGVRSLVLLPLVVGDAVEGALACSLLQDERRWPEELVQRLRLLAEIFAIVLLRRRAQVALEESESRFRAMADAAPVLLWMAGPDGLCVDFNRTWLEFTGRTLEQEKGDGWVQGVHPDDRDGCMASYREALAARRPFTIEYRLRRADGAYRSVLDHGIPRFAGNGAAFSGYIGSAVDLTEIREAEAEAEHGREELAHALRVATLGELAATLAHEINQPLTAIVSNAQAIRLSLDSNPLDQQELTDALQDISADARRASEVIRRLRALFRKDHSGRRPLDVNDAIVEVTSLLGKDLERKRVALQLDLGKGLPPVLGDMVQLQQVFLNVVVNACDAMNGAGDDPRRLLIQTAHREPGTIAIDIRDSGKGVQKAELGHIFDRFVTTKPEGLGMGLAISRSIIEAHAGRIWATCNPDRGLTIHCELPCVPLLSRDPGPKESGRHDPVRYT